MLSKKIILKIILFSMLLLVFSGCASKKAASNFPKDSKAYPERGTALVNGEEVELPNFPSVLSEDRIQCRADAKIQENGTVVVALPQGSSTHNWYLEENEDIKLLSYTTEVVDSEKGNVEGVSNEVQTFTFVAPPGIVLLKWVNIAQAGKAFQEKEENYLLQLNVSQ